MILQQSIFVKLIKCHCIFSDANGTLLIADTPVGCGIAWGKRIGKLFCHVQLVPFAPDFIS